MCMPRARRDDGVNGDDRIDRTSAWSAVMPPSDELSAAIALGMADAVTLVMTPEWAMTVDLAASANLDSAGVIVDEVPAARADRTATSGRSAAPAVMAVTPTASWRGKGRQASVVGVRQGGRERQVARARGQDAR